MSSLGTSFGFVGTIVGGVFRLAGQVVAGCFRLIEIVLSGLIGGVFGGLARLAGVATGRAKGARFLTRLGRWLLLNRFHTGFLMDGKRGRLARRPSYESNITIAGQGAGKSSTCVIPNIFTLDDCSLVITDTKGSIYAQTSGDLARRGFDIKVLNLMEPTRSHAYNPLIRARTTLDVLRTVELVYRARGGKSSDPFWDDGAMRVLRLMVQCLINRGEPAYANLANVKYLLDHFDGHVKNGGLIDRFVIESTLNDQQTYNDYKGLIGTTAEKTLLSFVTEAATALRLFASADIAALMASDGFDFPALRQQKTAVFVMVRQQDMGVYGFILNMFFRDLFDELLGSLSNGLPVFMLLDEFGHMKVPGFEVYATTAREYRVAYWLFLQSLGQLESQYGRAGAETILDGLGTRTFFGGMNLDTSERLSREIGVVRQPYQQGGATLYRDEPLMRPEMLRELADETMLFLHRNQRPAVLKMTPFFKHHAFRKRAKLPPHPLPALSTSLSYVPLGVQEPPKEETEPPQADDNPAETQDDVADRVRGQIANVVGSPS